MLTTEEKQKMIEHRIKEYEVRIFDLQMNRTALESVNDQDGIKAMDGRVEALRKAVEAVRGMMNGATDNNNTIA
jgi:hypothetical protein